jgi:hypothetical protein
MIQALSPPLTGITAEIACARRITVIPITDDGHVITLVALTTDNPPAVGFPTRTKAHPRVSPDVTARRLLDDDLGCEHADLRLVALLPPDTTGERAAVYTARVRWPAGRPRHDRSGRHQLLPAVTAPPELRLTGVALLLPAADLARAAGAWPDLRDHTTAVARPASR